MYNVNTKTVHTHVHLSVNIHTYITTVYTPYTEVIPVNIVY